MSHLTAHITQWSNMSYPLYSTGPSFFLEFFSSVPFSSLQECMGGFLINAKQIVKPLISIKTSVNYPIIQFSHLTTVHLFVSVAFLSTFMCSMCIVVQYFIRYYKYNLAQALDEKDHPYYSSEYCTKKFWKRHSIVTTSTSTLMSEGISNSLRKCEDRSPKFIVTKNHKVSKV
ncbi:uncharacterized protein LOC103519150 isoform X2 [Diaphorina citri]|uniref:Uncharacterized protein LOC103519150 isoform X2 n=1 Tax=Diaphorina citri TaxID=121845 RepID=A0A3Q0JDG6_DIACI|nr:uncharacterized protein LOC103519150 isoform X2 [Diaphorina citri]